MVHRLVCCAVMSMHIAYLGAASGDDIPLPMWQKANLYRAIQVVELLGVLDETLVTQTKTNIVWNPIERSLLVRTAVIVHEDNRIATVLARHVAAAENFLTSGWREQAYNEIKSLEYAHSAQAVQQEDARRPKMLISVTLERTPKHAWPRYQIYTEEDLPRITRLAFTKHDEQPKKDIFCITPFGADCFSDNPMVKALIAMGKIEEAELAWIKAMFMNKQLGVKLDYEILNDGYDELFSAPAAEK